MKHNDEFLERTDLVKIAASSMKWVKQPGLKFVLYGLEVCTFDRLSTEGYVQGFTTNGGGCVHLSGIHETILVAPEEYEKAVLAAITEMIPDVYEVKKRGKNDITFLALCSSGIVDIAADPRPWEDQYTITLHEAE